MNKRVFMIAICAGLGLAASPSRKRICDGFKLDLARAYLDMGDEEGAISIIAEILEEGNDAQKNEARELMRQIRT